MSGILNCGSRIADFGSPIIGESEILQSKVVRGVFQSAIAPREAHHAPRNSAIRNSGEPED
jgi:hypothetical protein